MRHRTGPSLFQVMDFRQATTWSNADSLNFGSEETDFCKFSVSTNQFHYRQCILKTPSAIWPAPCWNLSVTKFPIKFPLSIQSDSRIPLEVVNFPWSCTSMLTHYIIHVFNHNACKCSIKYSDTVIVTKKDIICSYQIQICWFNIIAYDELETFAWKLAVS